MRRREAIEGSSDQSEDASDDSEKTTSFSIREYRAKGAVAVVGADGKISIKVRDIIRAESETAQAETEYDRWLVRSRRRSKLRKDIAFDKLKIKEYEAKLRSL